MNFCVLICRVVLSCLCILLFCLSGCDLLPYQSTSQLRSVSDALVPGLCSHDLCARVCLANSACSCRSNGIPIGLNLLKLSIFLPTHDLTGGLLFFTCLLEHDSVCAQLPTSYTRCNDRCPGYSSQTLLMMSKCF